MKHPAIALLAAIGCLTADAEEPPLGRLFFTPEQRATLDRQRQRNVANLPPLADGAPLTVDGKVQRSSGRNTTWINGAPLTDHEAPQAQSMPLRPGETLSGDGQRTDILHGGTIVIHRKPARP